MRKLRVASVLLFLISSILFGVFIIHQKNIRDEKAPVIQCESEELVVSVSASVEDLLADVKATDDKSGDVSDSLVVEKISPFTEENTRHIMYAAIDENGNVGRYERVLKYEDYETPKFSLTSALRFPMGRQVDIFKAIRAQSVLDGDLSATIKYSLENTIDLLTPGIYPIEFSVMDSGSHIEYLPLQIELYDWGAETIDVTLSEYLIYLPLNGAFDPNKYYVGASEEGTLAVQSNVDVTKEGVYYVDYAVTGSLGNIGKSRLFVVVKG